MNLETVLNNHLKASGGQAVFAALQRIQIDIEVIEPDFTVNGRYLADRGGQMRVDIFMEGVRVFSEGFDGVSGWQLPQEATEGIPTSPAGTKALQRGIEHQLFGLHELGARGHLLELTGQESVAGIDYFVVQITYADHDRLWRYINPENWLVERSREQKALHPDMDPTEAMLETHYSDFRWVDGWLRPYHEQKTDLATGDIIQTTLVHALDLNPKLDPALFMCP